MKPNRIRRVLLSVLPVVALCLAGAAYAAQPDSQAKAPGYGQGRTIHLVEASKVPHPTTIDLGAPGLSAGDHVVLTDGVNHEDGSPAGNCARNARSPNPARPS